VKTLWLALTCATLLSAQNAPKTDGPAISKNGWIFTWGDEFNGSGEPDSLKWDRPEYNRRNNDRGPDDWWLKEDSFLDGRGDLVLRAKKIANRNDDEDPYDYSTGAIRSLGRFEQRFGRFEIRCRMPTQPGWWVAFWLMCGGVVNVDGSGEDGTEIDIMEGFGWTDRINHALHWDGYGEDLRSEVKEVTVPGIRKGFHTFALEWSETEYVFFVDSAETWRSSAGGVSKVPEYVKVTAELSTDPRLIGTETRMDPRRAVFPDSFFVDYVRVYRRP
jgi:beta-glucanase (GH16 family)